MFGLSESQIARRVKAIARAAGLENWEFFSGHSGRVGMARRMAQNGAPTHEIERQGRWKQAAAWSAATPAANPPDPRCGIYSSAKPGRSTNLFTLTNHHHAGGQSGKLRIIRRSRK